MKEEKGTWEEKDNKITATVDGEDQEFQIEDGKLIFTNEDMGDVKITFEK